MSKTLEETIKSRSTERKIIVDNLIMTLSSQTKDEDLAEEEGNEDAAGSGDEGEDRDADA
jgi:flagellar basal body-associated protein FliL